jgi:hypothetical protein
MTWRLAISLDTLRTEINGYAPTRSKRSDGTIGDPAHASRASRHNPNRYNVVTALDVTHDPAGGCDVHTIARGLVLDPHPELEYVISNGQVAKRRTGFRWETYTGSNQHRLHAHFAVGRGPDSDPLPPYDSTLCWGVALAATPEGDDMSEVLDKLNALDQRIARIEDSVQHIDATVPDNLTYQLAEIRRNLRATALAAGVPPGDIES